MFGPYTVVASIARGGTSRVMLAVHGATGARVALKVLIPELAAQPEMRARLHAERTLLGRVAHEGVVEMYAAGVADDGTPFLVMEYLDGKPLGVVVGDGPMDVPMALAVTTQVAAALAALHAAGVVHCDVKHDNVMVLDERIDGLPRVKLIDFGVSRCVPQRLARGSFSSVPHEVSDEDDASTQIAGTPWCMAPEQWRGRPEPASDVYSLGCMLFDLLTGAPPFLGSVPELMTAHLDHEPPRPAWLATMPAALERLLLAMLSKTPRNRPSMAAVTAELGELLAEALDWTRSRPFRQADDSRATLELRAAS